MKALNGALCALLLSCSGVAESAETVLRGVAFVPLNTEYGLPMKMFADKVNELGKGELRIHLLGGPEAMPPGEQAAAVKAGVLDLAGVPPTFYKGIMVESDAQQLATLSIKEQRASGGYAMLNALANQKINAEMLTSYAQNLNYYIYTTKELTSLSELKGMRLRSVPIYNAFFASLGIEPVNVLPGEIYTALERGAVQGYAWPIAISDLGFDKMTKTRVEPGFYAVTVNIIINKQKFDSLTPKQRDILKQAVDWFEQQMLIHEAKSLADNKARQDKAGIKVFNAGSDFSRRAEDVYWVELEKASPDNIKKLRSLLTRP